MKSTIFTIFSFLCLFSTALQAQVFVNVNATGTGDGTSWDNAFTDLELAINTSTESDQIWVAAGTYKPGGIAPTIDSYFQFPHNLELYGGFNGTETMLSERDITANVTTLSADHNGDDVNNDFIDFRTDNSFHVMWLTDTITIATIIDGVTIRNGHTLNASGSGNDRRAGGLLTYGAPTIRNCIFTQNVGYFGGALYPRGGSADGTTVENCTFTANGTHPDGDGSAIYNIAPSFFISDCTFTNNASDDLAGAVYNSADNGMTMSNCTFMGNQSINSRGGAIYNSTSPSTITNCTFMSNSASSSSGGAIQIRHGDEDEPPHTVTISNCTFNNSIATFGGAIGCYDDRSIVNILDCDFEANTSNNVGGAISNAFGSTTNVSNCNFTSNQSSGSGGAIYSQNDSSYVNIDNSLFVTNLAERGGAISISGDNEPLSPTPLPQLTLENCQLQFNSADEQGGGINLSNANLSIVNSVFDFNFAGTGDGIGGGISLNTSDSISTTIDILNSTFVGNQALIGAGISNWKPGLISSSVLTVQNTIFDNPDGNDHEIEDGEPTVISNGGNLSSDGSLENILTNTNDLINTDPMFVDIDDFNYRLEDNSPAVNSGIEVGAPLTDIDGNPRVDEVDMGAYENQNPSAIFDQLPALGKLSVFPNPIDNDAKISLESDWIGTIQIAITDVNGKVIYSRPAQKFSETFLLDFPQVSIAKGAYYLTISNREAASTVSFVK